MGALNGYRPLPPFPAGAQLDVTGVLRRLEDNAAILEGLTQRGRGALCAHAYPNEPVNANPHAYGQWGVLYRTAAPSLTWRVRKTSADSGCTMSVRVRANGVTVDTVTPALDTDESYTWDLSTVVGLTLEDSQVVLVDIELFDAGVSGDLPPGAAWGRLETTGLYTADLSDLPEIPAWPSGGTPTFAGSLDAALLARLAACMDHVAWRCAVVPRPLFASIAHGTGLFFLDDLGAPIDYQLWRGGVERANGQDQVLVTGRYRITTNAAETIRLFVDGALADTTATLTAGNAGALSLTGDISGVAAGNQVRLELRSRVTDAGTAATARPSRYGVYRVETMPSATLAGSAAPIAPESSLTWADLRERLNEIGATVQAAYERVQENPDLYERGHAFRRNYGYDDGERAYYETRHLPLMQRRGGSRLIVCGVGPIKLAYGSPTWRLVNEEEPDGPYTLANAFEETLIEGDTLTTTVVTLDSYPGLVTDVAYILRGDVRYAAEIL